MKLLAILNRQSFQVKIKKNENYLLMPVKPVFIAMERSVYHQQFFAVHRSYDVCQVHR